jgi:putative redox protein
MEENWRQVVAEWQGGMGFIGCNQAGGEVQIGTIDGKPGVGPMEMLLLGLAGCTGMDIVSILEKKRQDLRDLKISVRGKRADTYPKVYTEIEVEYLLWGEDLDPKAVEQAIELSEHKYCSASIMLGATAKVTTSYTIQKVLTNIEA